MKTPREIFSQKHQPAELKLDAIRKDILAGHTGAHFRGNEQRAEANPVNSPSVSMMSAREEVKFESPAFAPAAGKPASSSAPFALRFWQELVLPCRRVWLGFAAVWFVILTVHVIMNLPAAGQTQIAGNRSYSPNPEVARGLKEQKLLLAQLLDPVAPPKAKPEPPSPRSDRRDASFNT